MAYKLDEERRKTSLDKIKRMRYVSQDILLGTVQINDTNPLRLFGKLTSKDHASLYFSKSQWVPNFNLSSTTKPKKQFSLLIKSSHRNQRITDFSLVVASIYYFLDQCSCQSESKHSWWYWMWKYNLDWVGWNTGYGSVLCLYSVPSDFLCIYIVACVVNLFAVDLLVGEYGRRSFPPHCTLCN